MTMDAFVKALMQAAKAAGIEAAEAYIASGDSFKAVSVQGEIVQYAVNSSCGLSLRGIYKGKMGYAATEALDEEAIGQLVEGLLDSAQLSEEEDVPEIYGGDTSYPQVDGYNPVLNTVTSEEKLQFVKDMEKAAFKADLRVDKVGHNTILTGEGAIRIVNTYGLDVSYRSNYCGAYLEPIAREGEKVSTGMDIAITYDFSQMDGKKLAQSAVERAVFHLKGQTIKSGTYRVILENGACAEILDTFSGIFSAENAQHGLSLLKGRVGESIASDCVSLMDDPLLPHGMDSRPFDAEGVATRTKAVIQNGVLCTLLHNLKTAKKDGVKTTGNASKGGYAAPVRVAPTNFFFAPGEKSLEELMAQMDNGLVITELEGLHSGANGVSGDFSLSAKGYAVKAGKKAQPVEQITIAGNFYTMLKNIREIANDLKFPGSGIGSPSVDIGEMAVAGS